MVPEKFNKEVPVPATVVDRGLTSVTRFMLLATEPVRSVLWQLLSIGFKKFFVAIEWLQAKPVSEQVVVGLFVWSLVLLSIVFTGIISPSFSILTIAEGIMITIVGSWYVVGCVTEKKQ